MREHRRQLVAKAQQATRFEADDLDAALDERSERVRRVEQPAPRRIEHPLVVERAPAAKITRWNYDAKALAFQNFDPGNRDFGLEEICERVGEKQNLGARGVGRFALREPLAKGHLREARKVAIAMKPEYPLGSRRDWSIGERVGKARRDQGDPRELVDMAEENRGQRPAMCLIVIREELGLVGGHIDRGGAFGLARRA